VLSCPRGSIDAPAMWRRSQDYGVRIPADRYRRLCVSAGAPELDDGSSGRGEGPETLLHACCQAVLETHSVSFCRDALSKVSCKHPGHLHSKCFLVPLEGSAPTSPMGQGDRKVAARYEEGESSGERRRHAPTFVRAPSGPASRRRRTKPRGREECHIGG
jgi:hypothetical protein